MIYLIGKPVAGILEGLTHWLQTMGTANAVLLGAIGGMMQSTLGGPEAAYAFGVGLLIILTHGPMAAIMAAGMVPPLAMGLADGGASQIRQSAAGRWQSRSGTGNNCALFRKVQFRLLL